MEPEIVVFMSSCVFEFNLAEYEFWYISIISWRSVLLVEETGVTRENQTESFENKILNII